MILTHTDSHPPAAVDMWMADDCKQPGVVPCPGLSPSWVSWTQQAIRDPGTGNDASLAMEAACNAKEPVLALWLIMIHYDYIDIHANLLS